MKPLIPQDTVPVHFHTIFEAIPCPVVVLKPDAPHFTVLACNKAYEKTIHIEGQKIIGSPYFEVFPTNNIPKGEEYISRLAASLALVASHRQEHAIPVLRYDLKVPGQDEPAVHYWNLNNAPVLGEDGELLYIVQTALDITERVAHNDLVSYPSKHIDEQDDFITAANIERDASAAYLQAVIDTSQTGIFLFSPIRDERGDLVDFRFRIANRTLADYVGQEPKAVIGELGSRWFPAYKSNGLFDYYGETYLTGKTNRFDFHYNSDGIDAWMDIMSTRLNDDVLVTFSDYTPLKQLQHKMEQSLAALKRSNNNLEQFAYVASHDLQEPLRKIKSFGDMLSNRYKDQLGTEGADLIARMQSASGRMKILIEDLLTFSRITFQENTFNPVNLDEVIREVLIDLEPSIKEKKATINVAPMQPIKGDAVQMRQVFQNLLSNAIKFGKHDPLPEITISSSVIPGADAKDFHLGPDQKKQSFQQITIKDNGIGFEQQYAERIFQIFQRLHGRMDYPGTGVGLSIVQKVIEHHKGFINAEGEVGGGATFTLLLPMS